VTSVSVLPFGLSLLLLVDEPRVRSAPLRFLLLILRLGPGLRLVDPRRPGRDILGGRTAALAFGSSAGTSGAAVVAAASGWLSVGLASVCAGVAFVGDSVVEVCSSLLSTSFSAEEVVFFGSFDADAVGDSACDAVRGRLLLPGPPRRPRGPRVPLVLSLPLPPLLPRALGLPRLPELTLRGLPRLDDLEVRESLVEVALVVDAGDGEGDGRLGASDEGASAGSLVGVGSVSVLLSDCALGVTDLLDRVEAPICRRRDDRLLLRRGTFDPRCRGRRPGMGDLCIGACGPGAGGSAGVGGGGSDADLTSSAGVSEI